MFVDPISDNKFAVFSDDDRQFLARFFVAHPKIGDNFDKYLSVPSRLRFSMAKVDLWDTPRAGWVRHGIDDPETVMLHSKGFPMMLEQYFSNIHRHPAFVLDDDVRAFEHKAIKMAAFHDFHEAIATDFTPHDKIAPEDKARIELLAARVIFAAPEFRGTLQLVEEYLQQNSACSHFVHDFDKIHAVSGALFYESKHLEKVGLFKEFYDYALPKMKTDAGKNYLLDMEAHKDEAMTELRRLHTRASAGAGRGV